MKCVDNEKCPAVSPMSAIVQSKKFHTFYI